MTYDKTRYFSCGATCEKVEKENGSTSDNEILFSQIKTQRNLGVIDVVIPRQWDIRTGNDVILYTVLILLFVRDEIKNIFCGVAYLNKFHRGLFKNK